MHPVSSNTMLHRKSSLNKALFTLILTTASAGRHKEPSPPPTCDNMCFTKMRECTPTCKDSKYARHPIACAVACECQVSKAVAYCRDECEYDCKDDWPPAMGEVEGVEG
ncbi:uncharacterized protein M421DRAFT_393413 [Didymella exigua CBS 183.55]|uniref:Uncharacterized protein n=1 Tax=Didymella exigua CBS 183.55 TaxID=1150837 RepID=A0A6A5RKH6_9PLEO|nr:uncharacterized protein M421DRAFT_393413 [Didymella exigua CBS 183.55]KAF1927780.1 hypothetical protein M421DRAFT_393413 [Didymella exigua CBS 183.55]